MHLFKILGFQRLKFFTENGNDRNLIIPEALSGKSLKGGKDTSALSHMRGSYNKVFAEKMSRFEEIPNFNER